MLTADILVPRSHFVASCKYATNVLTMCVNALSSAFWLYVSPYMVSPRVHDCSCHWQGFIVSSEEQNLRDKELIPHGREKAKGYSIQDSET